MPVRRGHVAPKTTLIETIIRKFDTHSKYLDLSTFLIYVIFMNDISIFYSIQMEDYLIAV